ncbi:EmrB/QacA family drug resistance transporter [Caballeronia calidae]|uniref:EmrB/QacA family drug resistance transporter n=1 Tax=Caballeronia calidae TaxID=1777139 RepID=A0A158DV09_9BURK|nr:multidrug transporter subunit MdtD [Caballeronia calidae]SAK98394.1 EmrB/QacA family drug resistance transporter [Caballeronia calidae]
MSKSQVTRKVQKRSQGQDERRLTVTLWLVAASFFMQALDTTIVNTALPAMARGLGEAPLHMQSVIVAYSLTMALTIPLSGFLADRWGTRRVFFWAIIVFTGSSLLCANAQSLWQLVLFRVLQGVGGGMLSPVGRLALLHSFSRERLLPALGFVSIPGMIGPLLGPTLGGWLVDFASWHWIFLINAPVGIIGCVMTATQMADGKTVKSSVPFDLKGYALLALSMLAITIGLDGFSELGLRAAAVLALLVFAGCCILAYAAHARAAPSPLFSLKLFSIPTFKVGLAGNLFARIGCGGMSYLLPLVQQVSLGYSPTEAGLMMLPVAAAGMLSRRVAIILIPQFGYRRVLVGNTLLVGASMSSLALLSPAQHIFVHILIFTLFGMANSVQFTAMNSFTLKDLDKDSASSGNSLFSLTQMLSMSLGVTVAGMLLTQLTSLIGRHNSLQILSAFHATFVCLGLLTAVSAWIFAGGGRGRGKILHNVRDGRTK